MVRRRCEACGEWDEEDSLRCQACGGKLRVDTPVIDNAMVIAFMIVVLPMILGMVMAAFHEDFNLIRWPLLARLAEAGLSTTLGGGGLLIWRWFKNRGLAQRFRELDRDKREAEEYEDE